MCSRFLLVLFQYKFHQKGSILPSVLPFLLFSHKKHHSPPNFHFPLILLSVKLNLNFYTSHLSSILFSSLIADFIFALNYLNQLFLIHQEFTLVSILIPDKNCSIIIYIFFLLYYILGAKNCPLALISQGVWILKAGYKCHQNRIYVPPKPDINATKTGYTCQKPQKSGYRCQGGGYKCQSLIFPDK